MLRISFILFLLVALGQSCATQKKVSGGDFALLANCWTDSREEKKDGSDTLIYRPCSYREFPPSRYRHRLEMNADGTASSLKLAPNDAHYIVPAKWSLDRVQKVVTVKDGGDTLLFKFKILELSKDLLLIERIR